MEPKWGQDGAKILQNRAKMGPRGPEMEPKWGQDGVKTAKNKKKRLHNKKVGGVYLRRHIFSEKEANIDSTWFPK